MASILITSFGTRGDIQPFLGLGRVLAERGHRVTFGCDELYRELITGRGLAWRRVGATPSDYLPGLMRTVARESHPFKRGMVFLANWSHFTREERRQDLAACRGEFDGLITNGLQLKELLDLGMVSGPVAVGIYCPLGMGEVAKFQSELACVLKLHAICGDLIPAAGYMMTRLKPTGFWFDADADFDPDPGLRAFLDSGDPPVVVSMGSMAGFDAGRFSAGLFDALARSGQRAVIQAGWAGLGGLEVPEGVHVTGDVPHDWLFPRAACVVHHGGSGTTAAVLRAGKPSVFLPFWADQPIWASMVYGRGAGTAILDPLDFDPVRLAAAIREAAHGGEAAAAARALGQAVAAETGTVSAAEHFERELSLFAET